MSFPPPELGHFILHSYVRPTMTAGHYELVTDQPDLPFAVAEERTHVIVSSPRYTMPPEQILSSFPPANAEGAFGDRLPQIVLKRRTLPWERNPAGVPEVSLTPWLALVVVAEGEGELSTATPVAQCVTAGTALLDPGDKDVEQGLYLAVTETVVHKIFPCEQDLQLPDPRARGRHPRHRAGHRRRRRLAGRRAGQPAAGVRHRQRQAGPLPGLPRQPRGPARRAAAAPAGRRLLRVRAGPGLDAC